MSEDEDEQAIRVIEEGVSGQNSKLREVTRYLERIGAWLGVDIGLVARVG